MPHVHPSLSFGTEYADLGLASVVVAASEDLERFIRKLVEQADTSDVRCDCGFAGRGFKVRPEYMRCPLQATDGRILALATLHLSIE